MKKILIIGSCGAGKSTLAKKLSLKTGLPLIGLDQLYWKPGWIKTERPEWRAKVAEMVKQEKWIMEGNYKNTFDIMFPACEAIIFLDFNRFVCLFGILKRRIFKNRADKLNNCPEKIDWKLIKWVLWEYPRRGREKIIHFLEKYKSKRVIILRNR